MFKNTGRFLQLSYRLSKLYIEYKIRYDDNDEEKLQQLGIHLRKNFEYLGPTFVKLGQMLSLRFDVLHPIICKELRKLLDDEKEISFRKIKSILEKEYKSPLEKVFKNFDKVPLATASIAQVHKAQLKNGQKVIVKIRKPEVKERFNEDIEILFSLARFSSILPKIKNLNLLGIMEEFSEWTKDELNFLKEGRNIKKFQKNLSCFDFIVIPNFHDELSRENILVMDYLEGVTLNEAITAIQDKDDKILKQMKKDNIDLDEFVKKYPEVLLKQIFEDGFFNADPHPANIVLLPNNKIGLIDFGQVGKLNEIQLSHLFIGVLGFLEKDVDSLIDLAIEIGKAEKKDLDMDFVREKVYEVLEEVRKSSIDELKSMDLFNEMASLCYHANLKVPAEFTALGKEFAILDGMADIISPDLKLMDVLKPVCLKMYRKDIQNRFTGSKLLKSFSKFLLITEELPETIADVLEGFKKGKIQLVVSNETSKKNNHFGLKITMILLLSASISFFTAIRGNLTVIESGVNPNLLFTTALAFPFVFTLLYFLTRKKLNL